MSHVTAGRAAALAVAALVTGSIGTLLISEPAEALPTAQRSCSSAKDRSFGYDHGWVAVNSAVTVDNGKVARKVVVNFTADVYAEQDNTMLIGYKVDKGPVQTVGQTVFFVTPNVYMPNFPLRPAHSMAVLDVAKGRHRIQPYVKLKDYRIHTGAFLHGRCLTAEAYTN